MFRIALLFPATALTLLCACTAHRPSPKTNEIMLDGAQRSRLTNVSYEFNCAGTRTKLGYRQVHVDPEEVGGSLIDARQVMLTRLTLSDRRIPEADMVPIREQFRLFGWIREAEASCYSGEVWVSVRGMRIGEFVAHVKQDGSPLPSLTPLTVRITRDGAAEIK